MLTCTALLIALGGCPPLPATAPPVALQSSLAAAVPAAPGRAPTADRPPARDPTAGFGWPLQPQPPARDPIAGFGWPLQPQPPVVRPFDAPAQRWAAGHRGVDLRGQPGQVVLAAGPGRVAYSAVLAGRGVVSVEHPNGWRTTYEPLDARAPTGTLVQAGTPIGWLATSGSHCAPPACLHWGLLVARDTYRDPLILLGGARRVILLPLH